MVYYGDCRDLHYVLSKFGNDCVHKVHDTPNCCFGHVRCSGKRACINRVHSKHPEIYGDKCPHILIKIGGGKYAKR